MAGKNKMSFYKSFLEFEKALRNVESTLIYSGRNQPADNITDGPGVHGINVTIRMYPVSKRTKIFRERHNYVETGLTAPHMHPSPGFRGEHFEIRHTTDFYYLMNRDTVITDKNKILFLIKRATGVKLPDIEPPEESNLTKRIVIDISSRSQPETSLYERVGLLHSIDDIGCQPTDEEIERYFKRKSRVIK